MKEIAIYELDHNANYDEAEVYQMVEDAGCYDEIWIEPDGSIRRVDENMVDLFHAQNPNLKGWTRVLFGAQID